MAGETAGVSIKANVDSLRVDARSAIRLTMSVGKVKRVLELMSLQSQAARKLAELTGGMAS